MSNQIMLHVNRADENSNFLWIYAFPDEKSSLAIQEIISLLETLIVPEASVQKSLSTSGKIVIAGIPVIDHATAQAIQIAVSYLLAGLADAQFTYSQGGYFGSEASTPHFPHLCEVDPALRGIDRIRDLDALHLYLDAFYTCIDNDSKQA